MFCTGTKSNAARYGLERTRLYPPKMDAATCRPPRRVAPTRVALLKIATTTALNHEVHISLKCLPAARRDRWTLLPYTGSRVQPRFRRHWSVALSFAATNQNRRPGSVTHEIIALYQEAGVLRLIKRSWKPLMFTGDEVYFQETAHIGALACCIVIWSNLRHSASLKAEVAGAVAIRSPRTPDDSEMRQILWSANFRNLCIFVSLKTANIR